MSSASAITYGLPCYSGTPFRETNVSKIVRVVAVGLGLVATSVGICGLVKPSWIPLSAAYHWTFFSVGTASTLAGLALKYGQMRPTPLFEMTHSAKIMAGAVYEIPIENRNEIFQEASAWMALLKEKYSRSNNGAELPENAIRASSDENETLLSSFGMIKSIAAQFMFFGLTQLNPWDSILVCRDEHDKVQAIALFEKGTNTLTFMATHPDNLSHPSNMGGTTQFKGAGTQIMLTLMQRTLDHGQPVRLSATSQAVPFYERLQFEEAPENLSNADTYGGLKPMKLTPEKIRSLIRSGTSPFNQLNAR